MNADRDEYDIICDDITDLLIEFFKGDQEKIKLWLDSDNLNFGGSSPGLLMNNGRAHKVLAFIKAAIDENNRE